MLIDFKGKKIAVKEFDCCFGSLAAHRINPHVNLFVKVTKGCNAHCLFCSNANAMPPASAFNVDKLMDIISDLQERGVRVGRVNITGGEPAVVAPLVGRIIERMEESKYSHLHLHLNTNGILPGSQQLMKSDRWDSISMSLHHYNRHKLSEIYGCEIPENAFSFEGINLQKVNVSCNLIKGYIDNATEAAKMLDFAIDLDIPRIGFVALMKVNEYCRKNFVDIESIEWNEIPHV